MLMEKSWESKDISLKETLEYIKNCDLMEIVERKHTKSIYFKDINDNLSCIIYNITNCTSSILANVRGIKVNHNLNVEEFTKLYNQYKIFMK